MRKKDEKHTKKGQETTIGKIIYGFLLFMPLLAIGTTCLISTFNMSAKEETEIHYKYETNEVNSQDDLKNDRAYYVNFNNVTADEFIDVNGSTLDLYFYNIENFDFSNYILSIDEWLSGDLYSGNLLLHLYITDDFFASLSLISEDIYYNDYYSIVFDGGLDSYNFTIIGNAILSYSGNKPVLNYFNEATYIPIESVETHNVSAEDIFYRSVDKVTESQLFNWAENSIIYTTTNTTCNALSITAPFIPLLLSYWLIISVIYFLYDIALMLVWMIHRKVHELQESL